MKPIFIHLLGAALLHAANPTNIIVIMADDAGWGDAGCYGATKLKTPHIDRLDQRVQRFTDGHASASVCTPTRYSLITGQYSWRMSGTGDLAIRQGNLKYMPNLAVADGCYGGSKKKAYATARPAVFDLAEDPGEKNNLPKEKPEEAERLAGLLAKAKSSTVTRPE